MDKISMDKKNWKEKEGNGEGKRERVIEYSKSKEENIEE